MFLGLYTRTQVLWGVVRDRLSGERGAVATEYGLLLVLIALAIVATLTALGMAIAGNFQDACTELGGAGCSGS